MRRGIRITLIVLAVPILLGALLYAALITAGNTPWGRQQIEIIVARLTGNNVRLLGLAGEFPYRPSLAELQLADSHGIWLQAWNLQATWHPWALLHHRVAVDTAHAERIDFTRLPISQSHTPGHAHIPDIDVHEASVDTVHVGVALVDLPATLNLHASAHLRSVEDMQMAFAATRLDGPGTYAVQLAFDRQRMDAAFNIREPAHGPLAGLLGVGAIGAVQVSGNLTGLRQSEHVDLQAQLGELHGAVSGAVDLVQHSADLQYAAEAPAMAPRADLSWQRLHARGDWHGSLSTVVASGELQVQALTVPGGVRIGALDASLEAHRGDLSTQARIDDLAAPGLPPELLAGAPLRLGGAIQFEVPKRPFTLQLSHPKFTLRAKGEVSGPPSVEADIEVPELANLLKSIPAGLTGPLKVHATAQLAGGRGQLHLNASGNLDSTVAALHPWFRGPETAEVRGSYAPGDLRLDQLVVANQSLNFTLAGKMVAPRRSGASWTVAGRSSATLADLSIVVPALTGQANVRADLSGTLAALRLAGDLEANAALKDSKVGEISGTFNLADLTHAPQAQVQLRGELASQPVTLQADVEVHPGQSTHIGLPQADWQSFHAQGDLTLAHDLDQSQGQLKFSVGNLADLNALLGQHLGGTVSGSFNLAPDESHLQLTTQGLTVGALNINGTLTGAGPLHALQIALNAHSPLLGAPATLAAQGLLDAGMSNLKLTALTAKVRNVDVKLLQPTVVDFAHGLTLADLHASLADARLHATGEVLPQLQFKAELADATPGLIDALLPDYLDSGSLNASVQLQGSLAHPLGELHLTGTNLRGAGDASSLPPAQLSANVALSADGARVELRSSAGESSHLAVQGSIPYSGTIAVDATGHIDLARLNPLLESVGRRVTGTIDLNAQVAGTFNAPTVKGTVQLQKGSVHDYRHGVDLTEIEGTLEGTQKQLKITQLTAHAATGMISASGTLGILEGGWPLDLKFAARDAQPFSSSIVSGTVNADLTLKGTALHELTLAGNIGITRANINIPNSFPPNVAVLDVRRPGQQVEAPPVAAGPVFILKVTIDAPRQILVKGRGLDAELGGKIQIGGTARGPSVDGGFDLQRGQFTIAGSRLTFTSGRVSFAGSDVTGKIDPTLDFTASTTTLDTTITLHITGVADAPQFELTSVPQLPQDEILARLLFGESAGQLTAIQAAQLGAALVTLTGTGSGLNPLAELQKHLGLDRLGVTSNDTGLPNTAQNSGATIEAGRYVTNRIFVDLKQNTTGATQLQVDVDLTNKLKLQTRIGTGTATVQGTTPDNDPGSSLGLSYRFEY